MTSAATSVIPQFLQQVKVLNVENNLEVTANEIRSKNSNGILYFKGFQTSSGNQDSNLKSIPGLETVLIEEASEILEEPFDRLNFSIRDIDANIKIILALNPSHVNHWIYKRFFRDRNVQYNFNGINGNVLYIHTTYMDNLKNLDKSFLDEADSIKLMNPLKYENIFLGNWSESQLRALWTKEMIDYAHEDSEIEISDLDSIVIAVDPAVTSNKNSDETGLIVAGKKDEIYYVIEEATDKYTPHEWAIKVKELYQKYNASAVVCETNQGGDLVEENLRNVLKDFCYIEKIHASKGKILRAEPVAALYQARKVKHLNYFQKLEYEQMTFSGDQRDKSPNSLDAAVYAIQYFAENKNGMISGF